MRSEKIDGSQIELSADQQKPSDSAGCGAAACRFGSINGMIDVISIVTSAVAAAAIAARQSSRLDAPLRDTRPAKYRMVIDRCDRAKAAVTWLMMM